MTGATQSKLACFGGAPVVPREERDIPWPVITEEDRRAVMETLDSGKLVGNAEGETTVPALENAWAAYTGSTHCVAVANGTAALQLPLAALGVGRGDEVIVPALSFIATGLAPLHQHAVPVFADIDPVRMTIDPAQVEALISPRTVAIIPVHLHGLPAEMHTLLRIAERHRLAVIEDAAQAHGATYRGRQVGTFGIAGAFSLQVTKNLPTCGEGGLVTTNDEAFAERVRTMRQFGETIASDRERDYISRRLGWNAKLNPIQAAFAHSQLRRLDEYEQRRQQNIPAFLARLAQLPGIIVPTVPADATHVWHILRFRFDPERAGIPRVSRAAFRTALRRVLRAEGVPMSQYQLMPLPHQEVFRTGRFAAESGMACTAASCGRWPNTQAVLEDSLTLQKRHLNPAAGAFLQRCADAFENVWQHLDVVARMSQGVAA